MRTGEWVKYILEKNGSKTDSLISFKGSFTEDLPDGKQVYYWDNGKKGKRACLSWEKERVSGFSLIMTARLLS